MEYGQRTEAKPSEEFSVIVVDENLSHANIARSMLVKLEFQVMVYINPFEALNFLKDHEQDVDFCLVAVNMKEMHGFQFLDLSRELHKDIQVTMMSTDITWPIMKRCVELGARFLVKKPLDTDTVSSLWQHLNLNFARMEKIKKLFQGIEGKTHDVNCLELEKSVNKCGDCTKLKRSNLMWTPYLESKFASALDLLGEAATPKKIQLVMNIKSIKRKNISAHLQKHRKKIQKELCKTNGTVCNMAFSGSQPSRICETRRTTCQSDLKIQPAFETDENRGNYQKESLPEETKGNKVYYKAMQRALRLGGVFDELQLICDDLSREEANKGKVDKMTDCDAQENNTFAFGEYVNVVASEETHNAHTPKEVVSKVAYSDKQVSCGGDQTGDVKLVAYPDSEDDEIDP